MSMVWQYFHGDREDSEIFIRVSEAFAARSAEKYPTILYFFADLTTAQTDDRYQDGLELLTIFQMAGLTRTQIEKVVKEAAARGYHFQQI